MVVAMIRRKQEAHAILNAYGMYGRTLNMHVATKHGSVLSPFEITRL
jgi:hypothetical protein